jgi:hypothetical protein
MTEADMIRTSSDRHHPQHDISMIIPSTFPVHHGPRRPTRSVQVASAKLLLSRLLPAIDTQSQRLLTLSKLDILRRQERQSSLSCQP